MIVDLRGARGLIEDPDATLRRASEWAKGKRVEVLLADARAVFGRDHLESAARHAERAQARGTMASRSLAMETLLYLSGRRQVADAIAAAGIRNGTRGIAVAVFGDTLAAHLVDAMGWVTDPRVLEPHGKDLGVLGVSDRAARTVEMARQADLALERVALVDVEK